MVLGNALRSGVDIQSISKDKYVLRRKTHVGTQYIKVPFSPFTDEQESSNVLWSTVEGPVQNGKPLSRSRSVCIRSKTSPPNNSLIRHSWRDVDRSIPNYTRSPFRKRWIRSAVKNEASISEAQKHVVTQVGSKSVISTTSPDLGATAYQAASTKQTLQSNATAAPSGADFVNRAGKCEDKRKWRSFSRLKTVLFPSGLRAQATDGVVRAVNTPVPSKPVTNACSPHGCPTNLSFQTSHRTSSNLSWWSKKDKSNKPPWFPAGMGGTTSHHKQFRSLADRLKISNILHKVATQRLAESPRIIKESPHGALMKGGLESLPTSFSSRIRPAGSCPAPWGNPRGKRESNSCLMGGTRDPEIIEHQQSSNAALKWKTSQLVSAKNACVTRCPQRGPRSDKGIPKTLIGRTLSMTKITKKKASTPPSSHAITGYKDSEDLRYRRSGIRSVSSTGRYRMQRTNSEGVVAKSTSTTEAIKELLDSTGSFLPNSSEMLLTLKPQPAVETRVTIKKDKLTSDTDRASSALGFNANGSSSIPRAPNSASPKKLETSPPIQPSILLAPTQEPFGDWNASTTSTSQAASAGPVTYASLWDRTADGDVASDVISSTCMGSSLATVPGLPGGPREADGRLHRRCSQGRTSGSEETLVLVTDALDLSDNAHSSMASKLNSIIYAEELSLTTACKAGNELEACEHSKASTWSPMVEKETSHIDSPQLVTTFRDDSPFFLLSEGDCDLSHRYTSADADLVRHCVTELVYNEVRPPSTRSVQTYVDVPSTGRKSDGAKMASVPKTEERYAANCNRNQKKFLRKLKWPVRNLSAMKKNGTM